MKLVIILLAIYFNFSLVALAQTYDEYDYDPLVEDELMRQDAGYEPEFYPENYEVYAPEEIQYQEEEVYPEENQDWSMESEDLPAEEYY